LLYKIGRNKLSSPAGVAGRPSFDVSQKGLKIWSKFDFEGYFGPLKLLKSG